MAVKASETISELHSALKTARDDSETLEADNDTKAEDFDQQRESPEDKPSAGISDFKRWMRESSVSADTLVSVPDPSTSSTNIHHLLAHNALVYAHSKDWSSAYASARKVKFPNFSVYCWPLIHASSLSTLSRRPWVILPRLSHKPE